MDTGGVSNPMDLLGYYQIGRNTLTGLAKYPKIWTLGSRQTNKLFAGGPVLIQEKVDGSQISFGKIDDTLMIRSRGTHVDLEAPDKLFNQAVAEITCRRDLLLPGYTYRGEYLKKPKHNVIKYSDIPRAHIILFDVQMPNGEFLEPDGVGVECERLEFQQVPTFNFNAAADTDLDKLLDITSCLGGSKVEGVVLKNYTQFTDLGDPVFAKYVSPDFKEQHAKEWKTQSRKDLIRDIVEHYRTEARWKKAVQHLRERGELTESPKDIGALFKEVQVDFIEEEKLEVEKMLWEHFRKQICRGLTMGLAEWYKAQLGLAPPPETS
jgi:hypothetical protein